MSWTKVELEDLQEDTLILIAHECNRHSCGELNDAAFTGHVKHYMARLRDAEKNGTDEYDYAADDLAYTAAKESF